MASAAAPSNAFDGLTTARFQDALARYIDASKPDPLAKAQMENLRLSWEYDGAADGEGQQHNAMAASGAQTLCGTLTLSSDIVSVAIHAVCNCNCNCNCKCNGSDATATEVDDASHRFENELYIELTASATFVPVGDHNASSKGEKMDRKERATRKKLRAGMISRFRADPSVRRLLADENDEGKGDALSKDDDSTAKAGLALCEALIQQSHRGNANALEERVNVNEDTLEGVRRAIFSHTEDNLDVLELILSMPYLPRSASGSSKTLSMLAERTYLRLLEDAMFDACEKEGEDELLDELNISDPNHDEDASLDRKKKTMPSKRMKHPNR